MLADSLFDIDEVVAALTIEKTPYQITLRASTTDGQTLPSMSRRYTCIDSVLEMLVREEHSAGNGVVMTISSRVLEAFVSDERSLNLRFTDTNFAFFYLFPYYGSSNRLVMLQKQPADIK
jgi:hypothetical protein